MGWVQDPGERQDLRRRVTRELGRDWQKEFHHSEKQSLKGTQQKEGYQGENTGRTLQGSGEIKTEV